MFCPKCGADMQNNSNCSACGYTAPSQNATSTSTMTMPNINVNEIKDNFKNGSINLIGVIASVVAIIATFMPFISVFGVGVGFISSGWVGVVYLLVAIATAGLFVLKMEKFAMIGSIVAAALLALSLIVNMGETNGMLFSFLGFGFWLMLLANIAMIVAAPLNKMIFKK